MVLVCRTCGLGNQSPFYIQGGDLITAMRGFVFKWRMFRCTTDVHRGVMRLGPGGQGVVCVYYGSGRPSTTIQQEAVEKGWSENRLLFDELVRTVLGYMLCWQRSDTGAKYTHGGEVDPRQLYAFWKQLCENKEPGDEVTVGDMISLLDDLTVGWRDRQNDETEEREWTTVAKDWLEDRKRSCVCWCAEGIPRVPFVFRAI